MAEIDYENYVIPEGDIIPELVNQLPSGPFPYPGTYVKQRYSVRSPEGARLKKIEGYHPYGPRIISEDLKELGREARSQLPIPLFGEHRTLDFIGGKNYGLFDRGFDYESAASCYYLTSDVTLKDVGTAIARERVFGDETRKLVQPFTNDHNNDTLRCSVRPVDPVHTQNGRYWLESNGYSVHMGGCSFVLTSAKNGVAGSERRTFYTHIQFAGGTRLDHDAFLTFWEYQKSYGEYSGPGEPILDVLKSSFIVDVVEHALVQYAMYNETSGLYIPTGKNVKSKLLKNGYSTPDIRTIYNTLMPIQFTWYIGSTIRPVNYVKRFRRRGINVGPYDNR